MTEHANDDYIDPTTATAAAPRNASAVIDAAFGQGDVGEPKQAAAGEPTLEDLRKEAAELEIEGRSSMNKDELAKAVEAAKAD